MKTYGIILASGNGNRYNKEIPKQFTILENKTLIEHTVDVFENCNSIDRIIVVVTPNYTDLARKILSKYTKIECILEGGETRKESSYIGVSSILDIEANILIHDCARPFLSQKILNECIQNLDLYNAIAVAVPCIDTVINVENSIIKNIPERSKMMCIQTPQGFKLSLIKKAHELSRNDSNFTDDCGLVIKHNLSNIKIITGDIENIKITYPNDFYRAEQILKQKRLSSIEKED